MRRNRISIKWSIIWTALHSISLFVVGILLNYSNIKNSFFQLLFLGFGVTIFARIVRIFTAKNKFVVDKWFIFWSLLNAFTIWLGYLTINYFGLTDQFWNIVLIAAFLVVMAHFIRRFKLPNLRLIIISLIILGVLFYATSEQTDFKGIISGTAESDSDYENKLSDLKENIKVAVTEIKEDLNPTSLKNAQITFDELNGLRADKGLRRLDWDKRAYELAVSRSKDMAERGYFSHLTPEGECMLTLKSEYGFSSSETVAENIWMVSGGLADPDEALTSWLGSSGHRANLFYKDHVKGAIGCYGRYCVFNGVHNDQYGLGAAPCSMYD